MSCMSWLKPASKKRNKNHQNSDQDVSGTPLDIPGGLAGIRQRMAEMGHFMNHASPVGDEYGTQRSNVSLQSLNGQKSNGESVVVNGLKPNSLGPNPNSRRSSHNGGIMPSQRDISGDGDEGFMVSADLCTEDGRPVKSRSSFAPPASNAVDQEKFHRPSPLTQVDRTHADWRTSKPPIPTSSKTSSLPAQEDKDLAGIDHAVSTFMEKKREDEQKKERAARKRAMFLASMDRSEDSNSQSITSDELRSTPAAMQQEDQASKSGTPIPPSFPSSDQLTRRSEASMAKSQPPPPPPPFAQPPQQQQLSPRPLAFPPSPPSPLHRPSPPIPAVQPDWSESFSPPAFRLPRAHEHGISLIDEKFGRQHNGEARRGSEHDRSAGYSNISLLPHAVTTGQTSHELSAPSDLQRQLQDLRRMQNEIELYSPTHGIPDFSSASLSTPSFAPFTPRSSVLPSARHADVIDSFQDSIPAKMAAFKRQHPNGSFHQWLLRLTPEDITRAISTSNGGTGIWRQMWERISPHDSSLQSELSPTLPLSHQQHRSPYDHVHLESSLYAGTPQAYPHESSNRVLQSADMSPSFADSYKRDVQHSPPIRQVYNPSDSRHQLGSSLHQHSDAPAASYTRREAPSFYQRQASPGLNPSGHQLGMDRGGFVSFRAMHLLGPPDHRAEGRKWQYPASPQLDMASTSSNYERRALQFAGSQV